MRLRRFLATCLGSVVALAATGLAACLVVALTVLPALGLVAGLGLWVWWTR